MWFLFGSTHSRSLLLMCANEKEVKTVSTQIRLEGIILVLASNRGSFSGIRLKLKVAGKRIMFMREWLSITWRPRISIPEKYVFLSPLPWKCADFTFFMIRFLELYTHPGVCCQHSFFGNPRGIRQQYRFNCWLSEWRERRAIEHMTLYASVNFFYYMIPKVIDTFCLELPQTQVIIVKNSYRFPWI